METNYSRLKKLLKNDRDSTQILKSFKTGKFTEHQAIKIQSVISRAESKIPANNQAAKIEIEKLKEIVSVRIRDNLEPTRKQLISAIILSGAFITRNDIPLLRQNLASSIIKAKENYSNTYNRGSITSVDGSTQIDENSYKIISHYKVLTKNFKPNGKFFQKIKQLFMDESHYLLLSKELNTLDIQKIAKYMEIYLKPEQSTSITGKNIDSDENWAYSPEKVELKLRKLHCVTPQDRSENDEIFLTHSSVSLSNLTDVYNKLDNYFKTPAKERENLNITFNWKLRSIVVKPTDSFFHPKPGTPHDFDDLTIFTQEIYNGFAPFSAVINVIDDDDDEYEAVSEVIDVIGDFAESISFVTSKVSLLLAGGGVTGPAAIATGAVSSAAALVSLSSDVVGAVVDIVNYFDTNDVIGTINISSNGDYSAITESKALSGEKPDFSRLTGSGAYYEFEYALNYTGISHYKRYWEVILSKNVTQTYKKSGRLLGRSDDVVIRFVCSEPMDYITGFINKIKTDKSHCEFIEGPLLERNGSGKYAKVHYGIKMGGKIEFEVTLIAFKIKEIL